MFTGLEPELGMPVGERLEVNTIETFSDAIHCGHVWVATDSDNRRVGFALMSEIDGNAHLEELDVHPDHGRRGIGSDLVETVCDWATSRGFQFVTLSTFRDVPWNRRFYESLGFSILQPHDYSSGLRRLVDIEKEKGLNTNLRVIMRIDPSGLTRPLTRGGRS